VYVPSTHGGFAVGDSLTIAVAQSHVSDDVPSNGRHIRELMTEARERGAGLIHFPEGALSGYVKAQIRAWEDVDWSIAQAELEAVASLAGSLGLWAIVGCNHRLSAPNRPHNSLFVISSQGRFVDRYDKRRCSSSEINDWYSPGFEPCVFEVHGFRFGCALCIEIHFMEIFAEYERLGVDCMLFSAYTEDEMFWIQAQGYAASNNYWLSAAVPAQCSARLPSGLIGPDGTVLQRCSADGGTGLAYTTLD
jgi:predicted amidohydrolase